MTNLYPPKLFVSMLVRPLLLTLNACTKSTVDENEVEHFEPSRRSVPVLVAVLSWLHAMSQEAELADPEDFYSDGVSKINIETLFQDLHRMKKASSLERNRNFHFCAHPFLLVSVVCHCLVFRSEVTACPKLRYSRQAVNAIYYKWSPRWRCLRQ